MKVTKKKFGDILFELDYLLIVFSLIIIRLPILFGQRYNLIYYAPFFLPFLVMIFIKLLYIRNIKLPFSFDRKLMLPFIIFWSIWIFALIRTAIYEYSFDTFFIAGFLFTLLILGGHLFLSYWTTLGNIYRHSKIRQATLFAFGAYIAFNLFVYLIGIIPEDEIYLAQYPAQMLSFLGVEVNRVLFPLANGISEFGLLAGVTVVLLIPIISTKERFRCATLVSMILASIVTILFTDTRSAVIFTVATVVIIVLPQNLFRYARWFPIVVSFLPVLVTVFAPSIFTDFAWLNRPPSNWNKDSTASGIVTSCDEKLAKVNGSLSNRPVIWETVKEELSDPKILHFVGFGYRGQVVSKLSDQYSCLFQSYVRGNLAAAHNLWFQSILSIGYIGVVSTLIFLGTLIVKIEELYDSTNDPTFKGVLAAVIYIIFVGTLAASITPDYYGHFILLLWATIVVAVDVSYSTNVDSNQ